MPALRLILLPGLDGDPRVFARQVAAFPDAALVRWPRPWPGERLGGYAARVAASVGTDGPCVVVGVSFGGVVAAEVCRRLDARCCVLIASARDVAGLPRSVRLGRRVAGLVPVAVVDGAVRAAWSTVAGGGRRGPFRRWAVRELLAWQPAGPPACRVVQVHGDRDRVFPAGAGVADHLVRGGGHMISLTHAAEVNRVLAAVVGAGD